MYLNMYNLRISTLNKVACSIRFLYYYYYIIIKYVSTLKQTLAAHKPFHIVHLSVLRLQRDAIGTQTMGLNSKIEAYCSIYVGNCVE